MKLKIYLSLFTFYIFLFWGLGIEDWDILFFFNSQIWSVNFYYVKKLKKCKK